MIFLGYSIVCLNTLHNYALFLILTQMKLVKS